MNMTVDVRMFGAFRKYAPTGVMTVSLNKNELSLKEFRSLFSEELKKQHNSFSDEALIIDSAFASESEILQDDFVIKANTTLAVLPPVCGG